MTRQGIVGICSIGCTTCGTRDRPGGEPEPEFVRHRIAATRRLPVARVDACAAGPAPAAPPAPSRAAPARRAPHGPAAARGPAGHARGHCGRPVGCHRQAEGDPDPDRRPEARDRAPHAAPVGRARLDREGDADAERHQRQPRRRQEAGRPAERGDRADEGVLPGPREPAEVHRWPAQGAPERGDPPAAGAGAAQVPAGRSHSGGLCHGQHQPARDAAQRELVQRRPVRGGLLHGRRPAGRGPCAADHPGRPRHRGAAPGRHGHACRHRGSARPRPGAEAGA